MRYLGIGILLLLVLLLMGCGRDATGNATDPPFPIRSEVINYGGGPSRYHDDEKGVTCWKQGQALSCIPDSQLKAGQ